MQQCCKCQSVRIRNRIQKQSLGDEQVKDSDTSLDRCRHANASNDKHKHSGFPVQVTCCRQCKEADVGCKEVEDPDQDGMCDECKRPFDFPDRFQTFHYSFQQ